MLSLLSRKSGAKIAFLFGISLQVRGFFEGFPSERRISLLSLPLRAYERGPNPKPLPSGKGLHDSIFVWYFIADAGLHNSKN